MNAKRRKKMILSMEFIARNISDEEVFENWLMGGVPDGDFEYGEWDTDKVDDYLVEDDTFREIMWCFLRTMGVAKKYGGLYCDGVCDDNDN